MRPDPRPDQALRERSTRPSRSSTSSRTSSSSSSGVLQADVDANNQLQAVTATDEWHLFNEPTVYVVDRNGIVTANFELIFSDAELTAALDAVK